MPKHFVLRRGHLKNYGALDCVAARARAPLWPVDVVLVDSRDVVTSRRAVRRAPAAGVVSVEEKHPGSVKVFGKRTIHWNDIALREREREATLFKRKSLKDSGAALTLVLVSPCRLGPLGRRGFQILASRYFVYSSE